MERIILGIDPGTNIMGFGIVKGMGKTPVLVDMGVVYMQKLNNHYDKLKEIFNSTTALIKNYQATELAIESPFFGKNVQSMLKLGRAQGAAIAAALQNNMPIYEYAPRKIKMSITGKGNADKEQVAYILKTMLKFDEIPKNLDATDGLAAAVCHFFQNGNDTTLGKKYSGWKDFIAQNPNKVIN